MRALALNGSPTGRGKTATVLRAVLDGLPDAWDTELVDLADGPNAALDRLEQADAFVLGSPMYRATFAAPLKALLDRLPRGMWGERSAPVTGRAVAIVGTGATWHHFLGLDPLRSVLSGFFAAHVVPPGLYVPGEGFTSEGDLAAPYVELASRQGAALAELAEALERSRVLRELVPQA